MIRSNRGIGKKLALMIMTAACLLLASSCSAQERSDRIAGEIRVEYLSAGRITMTMDVDADYGDRLYEFKMRWTGSDTEGELEILEPELIRGLRAELRADGGSTLSFDGAAFDTGGLFGDGMSPVQAATLMIKAWKEGYITEISRESVDGTSTVSMATDISETVSLRTWFDTETHLPLRAEISENGRTVLTVEFGDVIIAADS